MDLRLALYQLAARHGLDASGTSQLQALAGWDHEPPRLRQMLLTGVGILAAAMTGLGLIFWVAANWESLGRSGQFALLQSLVVLLCAGAFWRPALRAPLGLVAMLAIGGLFAYFGQTYQTGADPWQLFAIWAALSLPLCLSLRTDVIWTPWSLVVMTGISLWVSANTGQAWRWSAGDLGMHVLSWVGGLAVVCLLSSSAARYTGAGPWARKISAVLFFILVTGDALGGLLSEKSTVQYWLGFVLLSAATRFFLQPSQFDVFSTSVSSLCLNVLVFGWLLSKMSFRVHPIGTALLLGLIAALLMAGTVTVLLRLSRRSDVEEKCDEQ